MHAQTKTAKAIVEANADRDEHPNTISRNCTSDCLGLFEEYAQTTTRVQGLHKQISAKTAIHGRTEQRACYVGGVPKGGQGLRVGHRSVPSGMLYRDSTTRQTGQSQETHDVTFFISNTATCTTAQINCCRITGPSRAASTMSWMSFLQKDASRIRTGSAPEVAAAFRRLSLNILQQDTSLKESIRGKRLCAGWDEAVLDGIYAAFQAA
ncbi:MAG: hypothetical protein R3C02_21800 [Planctomycetaceae bacterium]